MDILTRCVESGSFVDLEEAKQSGVSAIGLADLGCTPNGVTHFDGDAKPAVATPVELDRFVYGDGPEPAIADDLRTSPSASWRRL